MTSVVSNPDVLINVASVELIIESVGKHPSVDDGRMSLPGG